MKRSDHRKKEREGKDRKEGRKEGKEKREGHKKTLEGDGYVSYLDCGGWSHRQRRVCPNLSKRVH